MEPEPETVSPAMLATKTAVAPVPEMDLLAPPKKPPPAAAAAAPAKKPPPANGKLPVKPGIAKAPIKAGVKPPPKPSGSKLAAKVPVKAPVKAPAKPASAAGTAQDALAALKSKIGNGDLGTKKAAPAPAPAVAAPVPEEPATPSPTLAPGEVAAGVQYPTRDARNFLHVEGAPDVTVAYALEDLHARVLTMEEKNAVGMPLPVLLFDANDNNQVYVPITFKKAGQGGQSPFSGECVMLASIYDRPTPGFETSSFVLDLDVTSSQAMMRGLKEFTSAHIATTDPIVSEIFWRLKWQFPAFEWESANPADIKACIDEARVGCKVLGLPHAPSHVANDVARLPLPKASQDPAMRSTRWQKWSAAGDKWVHPDGRPPCHPLPPHDKRADKLSSRGSLTSAVNAYLRSPRVGSLKDYPLARNLELAIERKASDPAPNVAAPASRGAEDEEMEALLAPPPKPEKPKAEKKRKRLTKKGSAFIDREAADAGDDYEESGDEEDDGFIVPDPDTDDDSEEEEDEDAPPKKKKKKKHNKKVIQESESESDGEEEEEGEEEDDDESEMEDDGTSDEDDDSDDEDEEEKIVTARAEASEDSGDEEEAGTSKGKKAVASRKGKKLINDKPIAQDAAGQPSIASLFASQQMTNTIPPGKSPLKLGAQKPHKLSSAERASDKDDRGPAVAQKPQRKVAVPEPAPLMEDGQEPARQEISSRAGATIKRNGMADKAKSAVSTILSNKKLSNASPAFAQEIKTCARRMGVLMEEFRDNEAKPHAHLCMDAMIPLIENMAYVINGLTQNQDKAKDTLEAHGELGVIGAKMLSEMMPDVLEVQKRVNALAATGSSMTTQFALAVAKAKQAEK